MLATWHELIDGGRLTDGELNLAGTSKPLRVLLAAATAEQLGIGAGDLVTVGTAHGSLTAPAEIVADGRWPGCCGCRPITGRARCVRCSGPSMAIRSR